MNEFRFAFIETFNEKLYTEYQLETNPVINEDGFNKAFYFCEDRVPEFMDKINKLSVELVEQMNNLDSTSTAFQKLALLSNWIGLHKNLDLLQSKFLNKLETNFYHYDIMEVLGMDESLAIEAYPEIIKAVHNNCFNNMPVRYIMQDFYDQSWLRYI